MPSIVNTFCCCRDVFSDLYGKAAEFKGKVSGEHGVGYAKMQYFRESEPLPVLDIIKGIKAVFDPNGILNPGKIVE